MDGCPKSSSANTVHRRIIPGLWKSLSHSQWSYKTVRKTEKLWEMEEILPQGMLCLGVYITLLLESKELEAKIQL